MNDQYDGATEGEQSLRTELSRALAAFSEGAAATEQFVLADPDDDVVHVIGFADDGRPEHLGSAGTRSEGGADGASGGRTSGDGSGPADPEGS